MDWQPDQAIALPARLGAVNLLKGRCTASGILPAARAHE